jgi:hypothetical protein
VERYAGCIPSGQAGARKGPDRGDLPNALHPREDELVRNELEGEPRPELNQPRVVGADDLAEGRRTQHGIGILELGMVEQIEEFRTQLTPRPISVISVISGKVFPLYIPS